jgi:hypothetical protein
VKSLVWMRWKGADRAHGFVTDSAAPEQAPQPLCKVPYHGQKLVECAGPDWRCGNCDAAMRLQAKPARKQAALRKQREYQRTRKVVYRPRYKFRDWEGTG